MSRKRGTTAAILDPDPEASQSKQSSGSTATERGFVHWSAEPRGYESKQTKTMEFSVMEERKVDSPAAGDRLLWPHQLQPLPTTGTADKREPKGRRDTDCARHLEQGTPASRGRAAQLTRREVVDLHAVKRGHLHARHFFDQLKEDQNRACGAPSLSSAPNPHVR